MDGATWGATMKIYSLLTDIHVKVKLVIVAKTENFGTSFMSENALTGVLTRRVETMYNFEREFIEDSFVKIQLVLPVQNNSDVFMKYVSREICQNHMNKLLADSKK
jgi:uncharacterized protein VirK/YbjX